MKIGLIAPGILPVPSPGHGAVEQLIFDYYQELIKCGHQVEIINTPNKTEIVERIRIGKFDIVHCHYDVFLPLQQFFTCPKIIFSSHYPYLDQPEKHTQDGYNRLLSILINNHNFHIMTYSKKDHDALLNYGANSSKMFMIPYGVSVENFKFNPDAKLPLACTLAKLEMRKRQHLTKEIDIVRYIGRNEGWVQIPNGYLGEWSTEQKFNHLTDFSSMVLLSSGENSCSLAIMEGWAAGLGSVITEKMAEELPEKSFITRIPESKVTDREYLKEKIMENIQISSLLRKEIREFAQTFSWSSRVAEYIKKIEEIK